MSKDKRQNAAHAQPLATELDEAQLEQARGGAGDYLLTLDGLKGESSALLRRGIKIEAITIKQK